jgi:hypothetical protein
MQRETKERWRELCERIVREQDPERFDAAILELLQVLEQDDQRRPKATLEVPPVEKPGRLVAPVASGSGASRRRVGISGQYALSLWFGSDRSEIVTIILNRVLVSFSIDGHLM